jgi:hypothetical protein
MAYTDLTGENFRVAHQALMQKGGQTTGTPRTPKCDWTRTLEVVAVVVGIILGVALLLCAASCGMARGAGWETGNYASASAWND